MKPIRSPYVLFFRLAVQQDPPVQPSRMKLTIRLLIATALLFASGCAKSDWIDRMLVTVDVKTPVELWKRSRRSVATRWQERL